MKLPEAPPCFSSKRTLSITQPTSGKLVIYVGGLSPGAINPPLRITVRSESGEVVANFPFPEPLVLPTGAYRVRAETADGSTTEALIAVDPGDPSPVHLDMPGEAGPALAAALHASRKDAPSGGMMYPSESLGPLASSS